MRIKLIVFDLDGTLLNTVKDLSISLNQALKKNGLPVKPEVDYYKMVGNGIDKLIERASKLKLGDELFNRIKVDFNTHYKCHSSDNTEVYDGVDEILKELEKKDIHFAVLSNKDDSFVKSLLNKYFTSTKFSYIMGRNDKFKTKPDPSSLNFIIDSLKMQKEETIYVGDSDVDVKTSRNCGVKCIGAVWGFRGENELKQAGADYLAYIPKDIIKFID